MSDEREAIREAMDEISSCDCEGDECALADMVNREVAAASTWRTRLGIRVVAILLMLLAIPGFFIVWAVARLFGKDGTDHEDLNDFASAYRQMWQVFRTGELE